MGKTLPEEVTEKLKSLLHRMGLTLNEDKTRQIDAREESFNFLGFTIRYDKDIKGRNIQILEYHAKQKVGTKNPG